MKIIYVKIPLQVYFDPNKVPFESIKKLTYIWSLSPDL